MFYAKSKVKKVSQNSPSNVLLCKSIYKTSTYKRVNKGKLIFSVFLVFLVYFYNYDKRRI